METSKRSTKKLKKEKENLEKKIQLYKKQLQTLKLKKMRETRITKNMAKTVKAFLKTRVEQKMPKTHHLTKLKTSKLLNETLPDELISKIASKISSQKSSSRYNNFDYYINNIEKYNFDQIEAFLIKKYIKFFKNGRKIYFSRVVKNKQPIVNPKRFAMNKFLLYNKKMKSFIKNLFTPYKKNKQFFINLINKINENWQVILIQNKDRYNNPESQEQFYISHEDLEQEEEEEGTHLFNSNILKLLNLKKNTILNNEPWYIFFYLLDNLCVYVNSNLDSIEDYLQVDGEHINFLEKFKILFNLTDPYIRNSLEIFMEEQNLSLENITFYDDIIEIILNYFYATGNLLFEL